MGIEDRDWYREKQIDWERGGLKERNTERHGSPLYTWILAAAILVTAAVVLLFRLL